MTILKPVLFIHTKKNMAIRTAILTSRNINKDTDFSKFIETVSEPGVIKGLEVSTTKVAVGQAWVPCERTNEETIYALVQNCSETTISGNGYVIIQISQSIIDNGGGNEDGTGIATISVVQTLPEKNYLLLAEISNGTVTDRRNMLHTLQDISTQVNSLLDRMTQAEIDIQELEEKGAIDHLEETGLVGEKYTLSNTLFKQATPTLANSTIDCNIGDVDANKQIHIQRITSKTASNSIKLKLKKVGAPTTAIIVEIRAATQVDVSSTEAYWYGGGNLICSGSIAYTAISTDYQEITVPLNGTFGGVQGQLVDVVVYQAGNIVNSTNYYVLGCDSTQYSEAFSYVAVNGDTRTRSKLMPYCISEGFAQYLLCKTKKEGLAIGDATGVVLLSGTIGKGDTGVRTIRYDSNIYQGTLTLNITTNTSYIGRSVVSYVYKNGTQIASFYTESSSGNPHTFTGITMQQGDTIGVAINNTAGGNNTFNITVASGTVAIPGSSKAPEMKVDKIFEIGDLLTGGCTFGNFNGEFYVGDDTITSVDTGSITLPNAIGYLKIGKYKIPYYL